MRVDIAVIGAGIAGASAACELAEKCKVVLIERESQPGYHTTGRSAAVYLKSYGNEVIKAVTWASEAFYRDPPEGFAEAPLLSPRGAMFIARAGQQHLLDRELEMIRPFVPSARRLSAGEVRAIVPELRADYVTAGLLDSEAEDIDVDALLQGYLRRFKARGGKLLVDAELTGLESCGQSWRLKTKAGEVEAQTVVNAAGAWADEVARLAGLGALGLVPKRRSAFIVDGPPGVDCSAWPVVADIEEQFYFRPQSGALFCSPADETPSPPCDAQPEELDIAIAADRIMKALDIEIRRIRSSWAGLRTFAPDKSLILGFDPRACGFFWLAGQGGYGIQTAPAMAVLAATSVLGLEQNIVDSSVVDAMLPDRFLGGGNS